MSTVYDASALLAVIFSEPGAESAIELLSQAGGLVSAVNWSEIGASLVERGLEPQDIARELSAFGLDVVPFDEEQANLAAALRPVTRSIALSLGDRSCLALAKVRAARVVTANPGWAKLEGFSVIVVRG